MKFIIVAAGVTLAGTLMVAAGGAMAQSYPTKPIRLISPYPPGTPEQFAAYIKSEIVKWAKLIKETGVKSE